MSEFVLLENLWKNKMSLLKEIDNNYPTCCDSITKLMLDEIRNQKLLRDWDIYYVRGHYIEDVNEIFCEDFDMEEKPVSEIRKDTLLKFKNSCVNCTCEYALQHSYIELLKDDNLIILDYSKFQFTEGFNSSLDKSIRRLKALSGDFLLKPDSKDFKNYYPSQKIIKLKDMPEFKIDKNVFIINGQILTNK